MSTKYMVMCCKNYNSFLDDNYWEELSGNKCRFTPDARLEIQIHKSKHKKEYSYMIKEVEDDTI